MSQQARLIRKSLFLGASIVVVAAIVTSQFSEEPRALENSLVQSDKGATAVDSSAPTAQEIIRSEADGGPVLAYESRYGELPDSLRGTLMRQSLQVDEQGNLRISSDIKRVFDFFLSTIEEEELEVILARIDEYLNYYLQEPALTQSKNVLAQYIDLKQALYDFEMSRSDSLKSLIDSGALMSDRGAYLKLLEEQLATQSELRSTHLDPEVYEAFYASEEAYDQYSLSRLRVESEVGLSAEEKASRLAAIDANAPRDIVESRKEASITDDLKARVEKVKQEGGGQEEIRAVRVEMFGQEAADRFDALDQERAQWKKRIEIYLSQRQDILSMEGLSMEERQAQVNELRESQFDQRERIRVQVYERKADA